MNFIKKIMLFIKNRFKKQEEIKALEEPKQAVKKEEKIDFIESLRITAIKKEKNKNVETLICEGDGLGIQKKISY